MARQYRFLTSLQVRQLYRLWLYDAHPTQPGLLDSAMASPINNKLYGEENLFQLAAILSEKIIKNHAWQDGNKRAALIAVNTFLKVNGFKLQAISLAPDPNNNAIADAHVRVAAGTWSATELAKYYQSIATPFSGSDVAQFVEEAELH